MTANSTPLNQLLKDRAPNGNLYYLYSFPRSGSTWMRMSMSAAVIAEHEIDKVPEQDDVVPTTSGKVDFEMWEPVVSLPFIIAKSHLAKDVEGYPFVYLFRDPFDVVRSWVRYVLKKPIEEIGHDKKVEFCIRGANEMAIHLRNAINRVDQDQSIALFVSYESMHADLTKQLDKVFRFLGYPISRTALDKIGAETKIERFSAHHNPANFMFNEGKTGLGVKDLPDEGLKVIDQALSPLIAQAKEIEGKHEDAIRVDGV